MDVSQLLNELNDIQRQAVSMPAQNSLILAGAGSGKTRVLTHRIAWLIQVERVSPFHILAVTFTNKAAGEMRHRIEELLENRLPGMWVGTFHGIAHRILRRHWQDAHLPEAFQVIDSDDQYRLIRRIMRQLTIDENRWPPKQVQWYINQQKDLGLRAAQLNPHDHFTKTMKQLYAAYEEACQRAGVIDFAELLLRVQQLWREHPAILQQFRDRFRFVLVDEFQDTNAVQYDWLKILLSPHSVVMAVGDDDQSIYGWRGAKIENIQQFSRDFAPVATLRLEQNYRSTATILQAANAVISHNQDRLGKNLWTDGETGEPLNLYIGFNEIDEARFICEQIQQWKNQGGSLNEVAILYRSNAQSRVLEESLLQRGISYRVYGGLRFFERAEIKDVLAYLRLVNNEDDDAAFDRIINTPTRGIGDRSKQLFRDIAAQQNCSLWQAAQFCLQQRELSGRAASSVQQFLDLILSLRETTKTLSLTKQIEQVTEQSGLIQHYQKEKGEKGQSRLENMAELAVAASEFVENLENNQDMELSPLTLFLTQAVLEAGEEYGDKSNQCVQLMTLHSAKGLEFKFVILSGMEEGLFPHSMSYAEPGRIEEERRLCYVGMTRARESLLLTAAESRRIYGQDARHRLSRFVLEIPQHLLRELRLKSQVVRPVWQHPIDEGEFKLGQRVIHPHFGEGIVMNSEGNGEHSRVQVNFQRHGEKWLVLKYAKLETLF
ncbi:MAG: DNA helicase II [Legionellales bacterium]|nr:DNA helicase II [Legionellales bacterium]